MKEQITNYEQKSRHCGLDPQFPANKGIPHQVRNDGVVENNDVPFYSHVSRHCEVRSNPEYTSYATINELICLSNMENINAVFINEGLSQRERLIKLNQIAIQQMRVLSDVENRKLLK